MTAVRHRVNLLPRYHAIRGIAIHSRILSSLCFGTVQLGLPYGIANRSGMPDAIAAADMIAEALNAGITCFDTAHSYGESERRLGMARDALVAHDAVVITKLSTLSNCRNTDTPAFIRTQVEESIAASRKNLRLETLPCLLLHRSEHLTAFGGVVWETLLDQQRQGHIAHLGVSAASPAEVRKALNIPQVKYIQLPYHLLDSRWERDGIPELLATRPDITVLARSALLQGLLTLEAPQWPVLSATQASRISELLDEWTTLFDRKSRIDLCFAYNRAQPWIHSTVVGMETMQQLQDNLAMFNTPPLSAENCRQIRNQLPPIDETFLNPACWPSIKENA